MGDNSNLGFLPPPREAEVDPKVINYTEQNFQRIQNAIKGLRRRVYGTYGVSTVKESQQSASQNQVAGIQFTPGLSLSWDTNRPNATALVTFTWEWVYIGGGGQFNGQCQIFTPVTNFFAPGQVRLFQNAGTTARIMNGLQWVVACPQVGNYSAGAITSITGGAGTVYTDVQSKGTVVVYEAP